jgi:hypothetical protein
VDLSSLAALGKVAGLRGVALGVVLLLVRPLIDRAAFELRRQCNLLQLGMVAFLGLGWRHIADRLEEATIVEPVDPLESGELDGFQQTPWAASTDELSLEQAMDGFGERVVVAIANASDRGFYACLCKAFRVVNRHILRPLSL